MNKFIIIVGSFFALLVILFLIFMFSINSIVKSGIEDMGSEMTGTVVTVDNVSISPFSGKGTISGFRIANPGGYDKPYAMQVDDFFIELKPLSLFSSEIIVHEIIITSPQIHVEQKLPRNNVLTIMQNIRVYTLENPSDKELKIDRFLMTDGYAEFFTEVGGERSAQASIASVEIYDLGSGGGRRAVEEVVMDIAEEVAAEILKGAVQSGKDQFRDAIRNLID